MKPRRILFVAMHHSIHVARWIAMIADRGWDLHMFPIDGTPPNPDLRGVMLHWPTKNSEGGNIPPAGMAPTASPTLLSRLASFGKKLGGALRPGTASDIAQAGDLKLIPFRPSVDELGGPGAVAAGRVRLGESDCAAPVLNGPGVLASVIRRLQPDLIHSMEFQHAGYLVLRARELYGSGFPPWLATNWGSDILYFRQFEDHRAQIRRLLTAIDYYSCECRRDIGIARELGYQGPALPVLPNSGGFDLTQIEELRSPQAPSRRKLVMMKGYHNFAGRAMTTMKVLEKFADQLKNYQIILYSVSAEPSQRAYELHEKGVLNFKIFRDSISHQEILSHFGRARIYVGVGISDAISTSVLEAMAMGAFPIQTNTSCCDEWFADGEGGFIVPPDDFDLICDRFLRALNDDALVDRAAEINLQTVKTRLDSSRLRPQFAAFYDEAFSDR
jgi:glycosyl transferase family 1/glycosyl transferase family 4